MATEKQTAANRENAKKCTGPRSEKGKAISSQNALKTGIDSKAEVMQCESRDEYNQLIAEFHRDYAPIGAAERTLLQALFAGDAQLADRIEAHMAAPLPTIGAGESIGSLMRALANADGAMVLIDGKPAGVVTRQDVLGFLAGR